MVVLAMNIVGQSAAQGDELRAWRHRQEPAPRDRQGEDFFKGHPSLGPDQSGLPIRLNESIERSHVHDAIARREANISV